MAVFAYRMQSAVSTGYREQEEWAGKAALYTSVWERGADKNRKAPKEWPRASCELRITAGAVYDRPEMFKNFRIFAGIIQVEGIGTLFEQLGAASYSLDCCRFDLDK